MILNEEIEKLRQIKMKDSAHSDGHCIATKGAGNNCGEATSEFHGTRRDRAPATSLSEDDWQRQAHNWSDHVHWAVRQGLKI